MTTSKNGFFEVQDVQLGVPYHVIISAQGFTDWTSSVFTLNPGEYKTLDVGKLRIKEVQTTVTVTPQSYKCERS